MILFVLQTDTGLSHVALNAFRKSLCGALQKICVSIALLGLTACAGWGGRDSVAEPLDPKPFQVLINAGIERYLGVYSPILVTEVQGTLTHEFGVGDGPLCIDGGAYIMSTRNLDSEDLLIYLSGGGLCWEAFCLTRRIADPEIPNSGVLSLDDAQNPFAEMSTVYVPYCDGGAHISDNAVDVNNNGNTNRYLRGLRNLSAALDVSEGQFPSPKRVVLIGASAGGVGTLFALPLVRQVYPDVPILVLNDSGIGLTAPANEAFRHHLVDYWNFEAFVPENCPDCFADGTPTAYLDWQLREDPQMQLGLLSYTQDVAMSEFYLKLGRTNYEKLLRSTVARLEASHPGRVSSFIPTGQCHTILPLSLDVEAHGVRISTWLSQLLNEPGREWQSQIDPQAAE
jgi:hypothetical protein